MKKIILLLICFATAATSALADNDKPISIDQLPANAKQFIEKYFSGVKISLAKKETELFDKNYSVVFVDGNKVEFDKKGEWKDVDCKYTQVPAEIIPQQIKDYVTSNYQNVKIIEIERDSKRYDVKLGNGLELEFDPKFNLINIDN